MTTAATDPGSQVDPPVPATGVIVDLRNFTPSLNAAEVDERGTNRFCYTLADFYAATLDHCMLAMAPAERADPQISVSSTGDGLLVVFMGPRHFAQGLLAAFLLEAGLIETCERHNQANPQLPTVSFGVGVESGEVSRIRAGSSVAGVDTVIGHCVNIAARIEALTKLIASARVLVGDSTVELCAEAFHGQTFESLRAQERTATNDTDRVALQKRMNEINRELCLTFLDRYALKGVERPLPLYRPDESATCGGVLRFDRLLEHLVDSDPEHLHQVRDVLCHECSES
ncbi:MAG: adenylate/guanylate cyclase domain-containing protein [Nannocystales bacterium]